MPEPTPLRHSRVVILEAQELSGAGLAERFRGFGATVHVVSSAAAAAALVRNKRIDVVVIGFRARDGVHQLLQVLDLCGVPHITCASMQSMSELASSARKVATVFG